MVFHLYLLMLEIQRVGIRWITYLAINVFQDIQDVGGVYTLYIIFTY